jgi:hypothetical protein
VIGVTGEDADLGLASLVASTVRRVLSLCILPVCRVGRAAYLGLGCACSAAASYLGFETLCGSRRGLHPTQSGLVLKYIVKYMQSLRMAKKAD